MCFFQVLLILPNLTINREFHTQKFLRQRHLYSALRMNIVTSLLLSAVLVMAAAKAGQKTRQNRR